jgi:hypothetical protein
MGDLTCNFPCLGAYISSSVLANLALSGVRDHGPPVFTVILYFMRAGFALHTCALRRQHEIRGGHRQDRFGIAFLDGVSFRKRLSASGRSGRLSSGGEGTPHVWLLAKAPKDPAAQAGFGGSLRRAPAVKVETFRSRETQHTDGKRRLRQIVDENRLL